jgi:hypothetical protein
MITVVQGYGVAAVFPNTVITLKITVLGEHGVAPAVLNTVIKNPRYGISGQPRPSAL